MGTLSKVVVTLVVIVLLAGGGFLWWSQQQPLPEITLAEAAPLGLAPGCLSRS